MFLKLRFMTDSNPTLSATQSGLQRNSAAFPPILREIAAILRFPPRNRTGESVPLSATRRLWSFFLWRAYAQSRFHDSISLIKGSKYMSPTLIHLQVHCFRGTNFKN